MAEYRIYSKRVPDLDEKEYRACLRANFGYAQGSKMRAALQSLRKYPKRESLATMAWDGDQLAAWTLKFWDRNSRKYKLHFWTNQRYRRRGLATVLASRVRKGRHRDPVLVFPISGQPSGHFLWPMTRSKEFQDGYIR